MNDNASEDRIRVLVVGETAVSRAGLEAALHDSARFEVVASTNEAGSAAMLESTAPDVVLMETRTFRTWTPEPDPAVRQQLGVLTPREVEVLRMLADGTSNKEIAFQLGISEHTVKFHVASILSKLNAGSRTEAVTLGVRMGLIYL